MKKLSFLCVAALFAGCAQEPVPVVAGLDAYTFGSEKDIAAQAAWDEPAAQEQVAPADQSVPVVYEVQQGDTLYSIAQKYSTSSDELIALNSLKQPYILMVGQRLNVPYGDGEIKPQAYSLTRKGHVASAQPAVSWQKPEVSEEESSSVQEKEPDVVPNEEQPRYSYHKVERGENLFRIGQKYGVSFIDIMAMNDVARPEDLKTGVMLKIPVAGSTVSTYAQEEEITFTDAEKKKMVAKYENTRGLIWPVRGKLLKTYGAEGHGVNNTGINIAAKAGTPVLASASGRVIYADNGLQSFGNLVLLRHKRGYVTAYGHMEQILVKKGEKVAKGQMVGIVGRSGNVEQPQLHFEVRRNARAVNPQTLLPR